MPEGPWGLTFLLAAAVVCAVLGAIEVQARSHGAGPVLKDGPPLWSVQRERARSPRGPTAPLVLIGSSRFELGIDPQILSQTTGHPVADLAIAASLPFPVLEDLANDDEFHGWALCDVGAFRADEDDPTSAGSALSESYVRYFHSRTAVAGIEFEGREFLQNRFAFLQTPFSPHVKLMRLGASAPVSDGRRQHIFPNRFAPMDFSHVADIEAVRRSWTRVVQEGVIAVPDDEVVRFANKLSGWVERIQRRGGNVIFLRMVTSFGVRAAENRISPRAQWDLFASRVAGIAIHYEDVPSLRDFKATDGSHLDESDVPAFTRALGRTLIEREVFLPARTPR